MTKLKKTGADFRNGPILKSIILFSLPIFLGSVFQQFYNMVDSIVVGKYVNADALAAVGSTASIARILVGVTSGFPMGASVVAAQFLGADKRDKIKSTISTTLIFMLAMSVIITAAGLLLAGGIMTLVRVPENIYDDSVLYFRIYMTGTVFTALYNLFASFLQALGDSRTPLVFLIISSLLNIAGDLFFVIVLKMGVAGVGWATVIAQGISALLCWIYVSRTSEHFRFEKGCKLFDRELFGDIIRLGIPASMQNSLSGIGHALVQGLINSYGSVCMAAYTVASRMEMVCNLPFSAVGSALAMFVGQNIGAGDEKRAKKGLLNSLLYCAGITVVMSAALFIFGRYIMLLFVNENEIEVINIGVTFMNRWVPFVFLHSMFNCIYAFLRGAGDSIHTMICMFADLFVRMAMAYVFALAFDMGFMGVAYALPCGWLASTLYTIARYLSGGWRNKSVIREQE